MRNYELRPHGYSQKSFYGKAIVYCYDDYCELKSYETIVAKYIYDSEKLEIYNTQSNTTKRHIRSFAREHQIEIVDFDEYRCERYNDSDDDTSNLLGFAKAFMMLGDMDQNRSLEDQVKYDQKIVFATMRNQNPHWEQPNDWDHISLEEKSKRLTKIKNDVL